MNSFALLMMKSDFICPRSRKITIENYMELTCFRGKEYQILRRLCAFFVV